jgi:hypothetical protein
MKCYCQGGNGLFRGNFQVLTKIRYGIILLINTVKIYREGERIVTEPAVSKIDLSEYYTASQAAQVLTKNSGKEISADYIRTLAHYGVFHPIKLTDRMNLYPRREVDAYKVEERGEKAGERFKQQAAMRKKAKRRKKAAS